VATIDREKVAARLREREEEIARRRAQLVESEDGMRDNELADYDQHPADQGTETYEQELDETTDILLADEARTVEIAQERLAEGTYGKCVECGKDIPPERLEAIPEAIRCIEDQNRYEAELRARGGPRLGPT
jgi:RNA polymerase-binding transcription factor DksA